jgi:DNA-directed RNA polymerase I subunit RPA49
MLYSFYLLPHLIAFTRNNSSSKILLYISAMLAFRQILDRNKKGIDKEKITERMNSVPGVVVDSLLARFTEVARDSTR